MKAPIRPPDVLPGPAQPSTMYRARTWRLATALARWIPHAVLSGLAGLASRVYAGLSPTRRRVVDFVLLAKCLFHAPLLSTRTAYSIIRIC